MGLGVDDEEGVLDCEVDGELDGELDAVGLFEAVAAKVFNEVDAGKNIWEAIKENTSEIFARSFTTREYCRFKT